MKDIVEKKEISKNIDTDNKAQSDNEIIENVNYIEESENKSLNHLKERKKLYEKLNYETPILNYLIDKKGQICLYILNILKMKNH